MALNLVQCVLFVLVIVDRNSVKYRKFLYYIYLILSIAFAVMFAAGILMLSFTNIANPQFEQVCRENPDLYPGKYT